MDRSIYLILSSKIIILSILKKNHLFSLSYEITKLLSNILMFNLNNTALIALFIFTVISFQTLSHAQLNSLTAGSASDLENNCYQTPPDLQIQSGGVWYDNANPTLTPTATTTFTVSSTDIYGNVSTKYVLTPVNPTITPTFTTINPICEGEVLLNLPTISNNGFWGT